MTAQRRSQYLPPHLGRCPFCQLVGTIRGLPGHVRQAHPAETAKLPDWRELAPQNWQISVGSRQPHAICAPQHGNPDGRPWWWAVIPGETANRSSRTVAKSGTTDTADEGRELAWAHWLTYYHPGRTAGSHGE